MIGNMEENIKNLIGEYIKDSTDENRKKLLNETWQFLTKEYDRNNMSHVVLITCVHSTLTQN